MSHLSFGELGIRQELKEDSLAVKGKSLVKGLTEDRDQSEGKEIRNERNW